jgi:hypothetical protein
MDILQPVSGFGTLAGSSSWNPFSGNYQGASRYHLSSDTTITGLMIRCAGTAASTSHAKAVIWADSSGSPGTLVATSNELTPVPGSVQLFWFASPQALTAGYYWLGLIADSNLLLGYTSGGSLTSYKSRTYSSGPSDPFGTPGGTANALDIIGCTTLAINNVAGDLDLSYVGPWPVSANNMVCSPYVLSGSATITQIAIAFARTFASAKFKVGIWADNSGQPGTLLANSSEIVGVQCGIQLCSISASLTAGTYWIGFVSDTGLAVGVAASNPGAKWTGSAYPTITNFTTSSSSSTVSIAVELVQSVSSIYPDSWHPLIEQPVRQLNEVISY